MAVRIPLQLLGCLLGACASGWAQELIEAEEALPHPTEQQSPEQRLTRQQLDASTIAELSGVRLAIGAGGMPVVSSVSEKGLLAESGLRPGDRLVSVNGQRVTSADMFYQWLLRARVGAPSVLLVVRDGRALSIDWTPTATVVQRLADEPAVAQAPYVGVYVHEHVADAVVVARVDANSPAALAGLLPDDVITAVNDRAVSTPEEFAEVLGEIPPGAEVRFAFTRTGVTTAGPVLTGEFLPLPSVAAPRVRMIPQVQQPAYSPAVPRMQNQARPFTQRGYFWRGR